MNAKLILAALAMSLTFAACSGQQGEAPAEAPPADTAPTTEPAPPADMPPAEPTTPDTTTDPAAPMDETTPPADGAATEPPAAQ